MTRQSVEAVVERAVRELGVKNVFKHGDREYVLALLARVEDWRPLRAPWWRRTEVCVIGADQTGNFFLSHSDGSVRYWDHATQTDVVVADSVRAFVAELDWSKTGSTTNPFAKDGE